MGPAGRSSNGLRPAAKPALLGALALIGAYAVSGALAHRRAPAGARRLAAAPAVRREGWAFWGHVLVRTYEEINDDRLLALAAGVVFYGLLALFPAITALVSSYGLFADVATISGHLSAAASLMPAAAYSIVAEQVLRIISRPTGDLGFTFVLGLALALWSANAGAKAIIDALNIVYGVKEQRSFIRLNLVSLAFTVGALAATLVAFAAIVVVPVMLSYLPLYGYDATLLPLLRWPALFVGVMLGLAVLYRFGPDRRPARWQLVSPGVVFATAAWLGGSALLSWYLGSFADYDATYGSLGAGIGLMMWLWMTAIVVLVGAELNSEIDKARCALPAAEEGGIGRGD